MSSPVREAVLEANAAGRNTDAGVFVALADAATRRVAWLTAVALSSEPADLNPLFNALWGEDHEFEPAFERLTEWPFLQRDAHGWRLDDDLASDLAIDFRDTDPDRYRRAHEYFVRREEEREVREDSEELWFVRGRTAYYLAGIDPSDAAAAFGAAFADPPTMDRTSARIWLSSLAVRQRIALGPESRTIEFFLGFRLYVAGKRIEAAAHFERLARTPQGDSYGAIARHLLGVIRRTVDREAAIRLLKSSVAMSLDLDLPENEVMARHSLVYAELTRQGGVPLSAERLTSALDLASENLERALQIGDRHLILWCRLTAAVVRWLVDTNDRVLVERVAASEARDLVAELRAVSRESLAVLDYETAAVATNSAAGILADIGDAHEALIEVETLLNTVGVNSIPLSPLEGLAKTVGGRIRATDPAVHARREQLLLRLNRA